MKRITLCFIPIVLATALFSCETAIPLTTTDASISRPLVGRWRLDTVTSDDVRARLTPLFEKEDRVWRRTAERLEESSPRFEGQAPARDDDGISHLQWMAREREKEVQALIAFLAPAHQLDITQIDNSFRFASDKGEGTRVFTPGEESSLFHSLGRFEVSSSWEKGGLVVRTKGIRDNRVSVTEVFALRGDALEERMEVKVPGLPKQAFRVIYRR